MVQFSAPKEVTFLLGRDMAPYSKVYTIENIVYDEQVKAMQGAAATAVRARYQIT